MNLVKEYLFNEEVIKLAVRLEVWGNYALFTRPEMKVERVSYDVMTPSAARGILEAIYWHPGLKWIIDSIQVCRPIKFTNIRRNEVKSTISARTVKKVMDSNKGALYMDSSEEIQQRASMVLQDVRYVINAHFEMTDKASQTDNPGKFQDIITRRIKRGQVYYQPYMGCREFPAFFKSHDTSIECPNELKGERDLGFMLYDLDYSDIENIKPMFFRVLMKDGLIKIPEVDSGEVMM